MTETKSEIYESPVRRELSRFGTTLGRWPGSGTPSIGGVISFDRWVGEKTDSVKEPLGPDSGSLLSSAVRASKILTRANLSVRERCLER